MHDYEIQILRRKLKHAKPKAVPRNLIWGIDLTGKTDSDGTLHLPPIHDGLKRLGIRHQRTDPGCPWQNGRIERLFGTLKQKLDQVTYSPLPQAGEGPGVRVGVQAQLNRDLKTFRYWYNHVRPHQNLDGKTPEEAWGGINPT